MKGKRLTIREVKKLFRRIGEILNKYPNRSGYEMGYYIGRRWRAGDTYEEIDDGLTTYYDYDEEEYQKHLDACIREFEAQQ